MAPEMVIMMNQTSAEKKGYSYAVDWWSLGITLYKLLTGNRPFLPLTPTVEAASENPEYSILFQEINYPSYMSSKVIDLIKRFLDTDEYTRLGSGATGAKDIKDHPFFEDIIWSMLELKQIPPPFIPQVKTLNEMPKFTSFDQMLNGLGKEDWLNDTVQKDDQEYFLSW